MKKINIISLLFLVIFSCSKTDKPSTIDCSHLFWTEPPITCIGTICQTDTCIIYYGIWKDLFLSKNQMTEDYFNRHITVCNTATYKYANQGIQFEIAFKLTIDWFETKFDEGFMIWLFPSYLQNNPGIDLPASVLLSKDQISSYISNPFFSDPFHTISSVNHLKYASRHEAVKVLAHDAGVADMCESNLSIQYHNTDDIPAGHPVLRASAALNWDENRCVSGTMDLSSEYLQTEKHICIITFCFTEGTQIVLGNGLSKPIEKIKPGDRILSFNQNSLKVEEDIVKQIDSVRHSDIVHITFNDLTVNENTSDHPYYVKNRGWCSYKPSPTLQKYDLQAEQLHIGDTCLIYKNNRLTEVLVKSITEYPGEVMTYNITRLLKNKAYFPNGILVSNEDFRPVQVSR